MQLTRPHADIFATWRVRILACALAVSLLCAGFPLCAYAEVRKADIVTGETVEQRGLTIAQCPSIDAQYCVVMDSEGTVYFERDADVQTQIASITKVMTCLIALDMGQDSDVITVSENAAEVGESSANLQAGDSTDFTSMLKALMIPSGNDAAIALAEYYGQKIVSSNGNGQLDSDACIAAFVDKMNQKAAEIGMSNTLFTNPHGLDDGEFEGDLHSTARDVALMIQYAMKNQKFRDICGIDGDDIVVQRDGEEVAITLEPTDTMLETYEGALGVKTGFTNLAGACFAGASSRDGLEVYAIILGSTDETQRFADAETCMDWFYDNYVDCQLVNSDVTCELSVNGQMMTVPVVAYAAHAGWVNATFPVTLQNPEETARVFKLSGNLTQEVNIKEIGGDVHPGDVVGTITFYQHNKAVYTSNLIACTYQVGPNPLEAIGVSVDRFLKGLAGESTVAKTQVISTATVLLDKTA